MKCFVPVVVVLAVCAAEVVEYGRREQPLLPTQLLRSFQRFFNDFHRNKDSYRLEYHVGDSHRFEQRSDSGQVEGSFAFVAPEGDEYEIKYEADEEGFRPEGDSLPEPPEDTDEVKAAKEAFFEAYEKQLELAEDDYENDDDEDDEESTEHEESSEEESSEEDDDDDDDDDGDHEQSNEEEEEEEEEEKKQPLTNSYSRVSSSRSRPQVDKSERNFFSIPYPYSRRS